MIAALYESRAGGVNNFEKDGISFGWTAIEDMLSREVQRKKQNQLPRVPGLKENFVDRDPWTRLNVKPAKIMQVCSDQSFIPKLFIISSWFVYSLSSRNMLFLSCGNILTSCHHLLTL